MNGGGGGGGDLIKEGGRHNWQCLIDEKIRKEEL
jgi:hypothetical protein